MSLEEYYVRKKSIPESIDQHMDTLRKYASQCDSVVEFGVGNGYSTVAFLAGRPKTLDSYDVERSSSVNEIEQVAREAGSTQFTFHLLSSLLAEFETTDLLFIDSLHNYEQVRDELAFHAHKAKKFLILHDTIYWAYMDQVPSNHPTKGIGLAIEQYMSVHPEWQICEHHYHQSGLTVYRRV